MECLRVKLYTPTGIFKNPLSIKGIEVYPLPPYSTIIGLIYRAMGRKWNGEYFQISIQGDYQAIYRDYVWFKKHNFKDKELGRLPLQVPILYNLWLLVHIKASEELLNEIESGLKEPKELLFLSGGEYPVKVEEVKRVRCKVKEFSKFNSMELVYNAYVPTSLKREIKSTEEGVNFYLSYFYKNTKPKAYNWIEATYLKKGTLIYKGKLYVDEEGYPVFLTQEISQTETINLQQDYVMFYPNNWLMASACVGMLKVLEWKYKDFSNFVEGKKVKIDKEIWNEMPYLYGEYLCELNKERFTNTLDELIKNAGNENNENKAHEIGAEIYKVLINTNISNALYRNGRLTQNFKSEYKLEIGNKFLEALKNLNKPIEKLTDQEKDYIFKEIKECVKQKFAKALEEEIIETSIDGIELTCSFCNHRKAIKFVEERNFTPLFASFETMRNFFWDNIPICKECAISLFFSSISFVSSGAQKQIFIYIPQNLEETYRINTIKELEEDIMSEKNNKGNKSFYSWMNKLVKDEIQKTKWMLESIYFVELEAPSGSNDVRIYSFHISDRIAQAIRTEIKGYPKELSNIFSEFMFYIYTGKSLYDFLLYLLSGFLRKKSYENLKDNTVDARIVNAGKNMKISESLLFFINFQEVLNMNEQRNYIYWAFNEGKKLKSYYIKSEGNQKKLEELTYKLLEAIRRKDQGYFSQNLIKAYLRVEKEIPYFFIEVLNDKNFSMIAYAFLMGLNSELERKDKEEQANDEGENSESA
ncbi:MAG: type I-B CRISPR-associated protein Cas5b [Thermocrinis sp.]|nr:type I-B CRISPR-associated protein Cas5b [Thermocrinis sp.]